MEASGARRDVLTWVGTEASSLWMEKLLMLVGVFHFPTDYGMEIGELAREVRCIRNVWSCDACGHEFETSAYLPFEQGELQNTAL